MEINKLKEAYYFLKDYHKRRELDEYLERSSINALEDILQLDSIDKPVEQFQEQPQIVSLFYNNPFKNLESNILKMKKIEEIRAEEIALLKEVHGNKFDEKEDKLKIKQAELDAI